MLFYTANRDATAEQYSNLMPEDQIPEEDLAGYLPRYGVQTSKNPAWGKYFPQLCAYLNDLTVRKRREAETKQQEGGGLDYHASD